MMGGADIDGAEYLMNQVELYVNCTQIAAEY